MPIRRFISLITVLVLVITIIPIKSWALEKFLKLPDLDWEDNGNQIEHSENNTEDYDRNHVVASGVCGENISWTFYLSGLLEILGSGEMSTEWEAPWYQYRDEIFQVIIGDGITSIEDNAFCDCKELNRITLPDSVTSIGNLAFDGCESLNYITLPKNLEEISAFMFANCYNLFEVEIPDSVNKIGVCAFQSCTNLTSIVIPDGVERIDYCTFIFCESLRSASIPDSVTSIDEGSFRCCYGLADIVIPESVEYIGLYAFSECYDLKTITFMGNAPRFEEDSFSEVTATVYYSANNTTWTEDVMQNYGGTITWIPCNLDISMGPACSIAELTTLDYLAFSAVAYENFVLGETVRECLTRSDGNKWADVWGEDGITYAELCQHIAQWRVHQIYENANIGFYAVVFTNNLGEAVLAYRGSNDPSLMLKDNDAFYDWVINDFPMILLNQEAHYGNQFHEAINAYDKTAQSEDIQTIVVTGHSLGGLWGNLASGCSGCKGVTFNAISALDIMYESHPDVLGKNFRGVDVWNFMDHANQYDIAAGMTEAATAVLLFGTKLKPYVKYASNFGITSFADNHGLNSFVSRSGSNVVMNGATGSWRGTHGISNHLSMTDKSIDMGVSSADNFDKGLVLGTRRTSYGGSGNDTIYSSIRDDTLIGGLGDDRLDGRWGDDVYHYFKGDDHDTIYDVSGNDKLYLHGFSSSDQLMVLAGTQDFPFVEILCNDKSIIKIYKDNRAQRLFGSDTFIIYKDNGNNTYDEYDITTLLEKKQYLKHLIIECPVSIEILDSAGNVVFTLEDGVAGSHYTDYGNFYIFEEEDGGYGKVLDLVEGYTARIVGEDAGTMDITYQDVADGALTEAKIVTDIPISESATATIQQNEDGKLVLAVDVDSDGMIDEETMFVCAENHNYENGFCTECGKAAPTAKFTTISTSLSGNIVMNFYMELSEDLVSDPDAYIQFTYAGKTLNVPLSEGVLSGGVYRFACPITSKNMTDEITAQVYNGSGPVGGSKTMDVATYCNWVIDNYTDAKTVNLMKAMLNYGASAQMLFNYRTDDLANAALSDVDKVLGKVDASAYIHSRTGEEEGIKPDNYTLLLDSETTVRVYFKLTGDKTIDEYTFTVDGVEVTPVYKNGLYYIQKTDIGAHRLDELHVFTCGNITIRYGGLSYVNQVMTYYTEGTTFDMASALFAYSKAAEAYIG